MIYVGVLMVFIALFQVPIIIKKRRWRELAAFAVIWSLAFAYALLMAARAPLPNPTEVLGSVLDRIFPWPVP